MVVERLGVDVERPVGRLDYRFVVADVVWQRRGLTLHESTHNGFLQIMHPRTFHIKNPSDAKLASLRILRKWPVSMATIVKIENY